MVRNLPLNQGKIFPLLKPFNFEIKGNQIKINFLITSFSKISNIKFLRD